MRRSPLAGGKLNALIGFAKTALNAPIPYARLVLRNIRTGQIVARITADELDSSHSSI